MVTLHEAAQSVAWFAVIMFLLIGAVMMRDIRKEKKDEKDRQKD